MLRLTDEHAEVTFAATEGHLDDRMLPVDCDAVFGETEVGDVLLLSISQRRGSWGNRSTATYRSRCLVLDPPAADVDGDTALAAQLHYYGLPGWSGERILNDEPVVEDGKVVGWTAELRWRPGTEAPLDDGFTLRFSAGHSVAGAYDRRTLTSPFIITIESDERCSIGEHTTHLDAVHALLAVTHRETPLAAGGGIRFTESQRGFCDMWEQTMMSLNPPGDLTHDFAYVELEHVGGMQGVAAWVRLVLEHRRAVEPVVRHALFPNQTPESRILSTAAAMEYWVASSKARKAGWAKKFPDEPLPGALARFVDPAWRTWIGDSDQWVNEFWTAYLDLKHFRRRSPDPRVVNALEISGRWLLTAALLDHCAGSPAASQHLFTKGLRNLGGDVRDELWSSPTR
jgi:hypothetical protein